MPEPYDSSDEALYRLVDVDELDALLSAGGRPVGRDSAKLVHLLKRLRATLEADRSTVAGLHRHIGQLTDHLERVGQATTLNPMDALRYLDDEQREILFDRIARDRLSMLRHMVEQAENARDRFADELDQVRAAAGTLAQRPDLPADVRAEFTRLLAYLPSEAPTVHRPPLLDFPDPEPVAPTPPPPRPRTGTFPEAAATQPTSPGTRPEPPAAAPDPVSEPVNAPAVYVDPYAPDADADSGPVYVDPYADGGHGVGDAYVDPYASAADHDDPSGTDLTSLFD